MQHMLPSAHPCLQPKRHLERLSHSCTAHGRVSSGMPGHVLHLKIPSSHRIFRLPSNTWFLEPTRAHKPNGISISSAICAQLTAQCRRACPGLSFPLKIAPSHGDLDPSNIVSVGPPKSETQTAFQWVQPFVRSSHQTVVGHVEACMPFP